MGIVASIHVTPAYEFFVFNFLADIQQQADLFIDYGRRFGGTQMSFRGQLLNAKSVAL